MKTLKNKIYKYLKAVSKKIFFYVLIYTVDKYNNKYHRTIKMKPDSYTKYSLESNEKNSKFKFARHVRISKYKNIFAKGYAPTWSEEVFVISRIINTVPWTYVISDLNGEKIVGICYEKEFQMTNHEEFRIEKVIKRKRNKLYVKWKG